MIFRLALPATWLLLVGLLPCFFLQVGRAGEFEVVFEGPEQTFVVENGGPEVVPTVYLVGRPDRGSEPVRKSKGLTLDGVRLTETLLSESVLIFYPDGSARWGYHTGFDIFRQPQFDGGRPVDPRSLVEYDKWKYDPLEPPRVTGGDMNLLLLHGQGPMPSAVYEIGFPDPIRIRSLEVGSNCDQIQTDGVIVCARLFDDGERKELIAEKAVGAGASGARFPVRFDDVDCRRVYLELSARAPRGTSVGLYFTFFEAILDARGIQLPTLASGENRWTLADDADGSHRGRLVLRWVDRPPPERIWDDFEGAPKWSGCKPVDAGPDEGLAFTGERFVRVTFPANGRDFGMNRSLDEVDLTGFNRLGIAMRAKRDAPLRAILVGIKNADTNYQYVRPRPQSRWTYQAFDIDGFERDRVVAMNVYWMATPGFERPGDPCVYDVDTMTLWHEEAKPPAADPLPEKIAGYRSPLSDAEPPKRAIPPIQEWFPLGFYDGTASRTSQECIWLFDQMRRLGMNTVYISNGSLEGLERILPLAEARGIRLIHQGGSDGSLYYLHLATAEARRRSLEEVLLPRAEAWIPKFRGRWGLLAWSLTEEIHPELSRELAPYYRLVRKHDPDHPPTVLHNNVGAAKVDLQTNRPPVITHDFYPFFWSPRSGPSNPRRSIAMYRSRIAGYYEACREHGASLWMMPQAWGAEETAPLDPPHYGYRQGMRTPEPGEIKLQGWVAIAEGATGLMFYAAVARRPGQHHLWDLGWTETANTRAAAELFAKVGKVAPLVCRLERDYREADVGKTDNPQVLAHSFVKRPGYSGSARYLVLASLNGFGHESFGLSLNGEGRVFDMVSRREVTGELAELRLEAGEGTMLLLGDEEEFEADCALIDGEIGAGGA